MGSVKAVEVDFARAKGAEKGNNVMLKLRPKGMVERRSEAIWAGA